MRSADVKIESPCHESWEAMEGGVERRFCGVCEKHVHNLSAMGYDDAVTLLRESAGEHLCVRYSAEPDGALRFRDLVPRSRLTRGIRRTAFAAVLLAACGPTIEIPVPELHEVIVDPIAYATEATADGGCRFTTGPFTTFHFPPGHAFCGPIDHAAGVATPTPTLDPIAAVGPVEPAIDPVERPTMGEAVAAPGPADPFVPCDPKGTPVTAPPQGHAPQGHAPPQGFAAPPSRPPSAPPPALMGDVAIPEPTPPMQGGLRYTEPPLPIPPGYAPPPDPFPGTGSAPPSPSATPPSPNPFPGSGYAPSPPNPNPGYTPPPSPNPFPGTGYAPPPTPPEDAPRMGSISPPPERMGRVASPK